MWHCPRVRSTTSRPAEALAFAFDRYFEEAPSFLLPLSVGTSNESEDEVGFGAKVKIRIAGLISVGFLAAASGQESRLSTGGSAPPIGLEIGQRAPQFTLVDQFGHEQSAKLSNGQNSTTKFLSRGAFDFGGGLDYQLFRLFGLRGEVRDFVSGNPNLNVALSSSTQHNIVASGGISVRF